MKTLGLAALGAVSLAFAAPAAAQSEWPVEPGDFVEVSMIDIDDGHSLEYAQHLAGEWRKSSDYAKSQGWSTNYQIWTNEFPRAGEAEIWLVTWFPMMADKAEALRREKLFNDYMATTAAKQEAASGKRATYRKLAGSLLMRNQTWVK
jgi:hypothetical protein